MGNRSRRPHHLGWYRHHYHRCHQSSWYVSPLPSISVQPSYFPGDRDHPCRFPCSFVFEGIPWTRKDIERQSASFSARRCLHSLLAKTHYQLLHVSQAFAGEGRVIRIRKFTPSLWIHVNQLTSVNSETCKWANTHIFFLFSVSRTVSFLPVLNDDCLFAAVLYLSLYLHPAPVLIDFFTLIGSDCNCKSLPDAYVADFCFCFLNTLSIDSSVSRIQSLLNSKVVRLFRDTDCVMMITDAGTWCTRYPVIVMIPLPSKKAMVSQGIGTDDWNSKKSTRRWHDIQSGR